MRLLRRFALAAVATLLVALLAFNVVAGQGAHDLDHRSTNHECAICILGTADNSSTAFVSALPVYIPIVRVVLATVVEVPRRGELFAFEARGPPFAPRA